MLEACHDLSHPQGRYCRHIKKKTEIKEIVSKIEKIHSTGSINSIEDESFGKVDKVTAVVVRQSGKVEMTYLVNKRPRTSSSSKKS